MLALVCNVLTLLLCHAYPAFAAYKAIKRGERKAELRMLRHLASLAIYTALETTADWTVGWLPFYAVIKLCFLLWLSLPQLGGASIVYRRIIHPNFAHYERDIDHFIEHADGQIRIALQYAQSEVVRHGRRIAGEVLNKVQGHLVEYVSQQAVADVAARALQAATSSVPPPAPLPAVLPTATITEPEYEDIDDDDFDSGATSPSSTNQDTDDLTDVVWLVSPSKPSHGSPRRSNLSSEFPSSPLKHTSAAASSSPLRSRKSMSVSAAQMKLYMRNAEAVRARSGQSSVHATKPTRTVSGNGISLSSSSSPPPIPFPMTSVSNENYAPLNAPLSVKPQQNTEVPRKSEYPMALPPHLDANMTGTSRFSPTRRAFANVQQDGRPALKLRQSSGTVSM